MPKWLAKRRRFYAASARDKYSIEQNAGTVTIPASGGSTSITVVPAVDFQGMRKVKHITVSCGCGISSTGIGNTCWWALVFVPQGTTPGSLNISGTGTLYEPNQYVMNAGVFDSDAGPARITSPLSRNLNSGDSIALVLAQPSTSGQMDLRYMVRYAITLQ